MQREQHFERTQRVVRVNRTENRITLSSPGGELSAQNVASLTLFLSQIEDGDFLVLERREAAQYKILKVVKAGCVLHEIYEIAQRFGLEFGFEEAVEDEVAQLTTQALDFSDCEDFCAVPFVTVDGAGTRDLDQALYVGQPGDGFDEIVHPLKETVYTAWYAIADASWFVRPGSALFEEAIKRGTSIYFADMSVPMLPGALSRGLVSLNAQVDRRALVFIMQVDAAGICRHTSLKRARICSRAKLVDSDVSAFLKNPDTHPWAHLPYAESLKNFKRLGLLRLEESRTRNVVHFNRVSLDVGLNHAQTGFTLGLDDRSDVDVYNEQMSLLCNMEGAKILNRLAKEDPEVLAIFRNHEAPSARDLDELAEKIGDLARVQNLDDAWHWNPAQKKLSDFFDGLPPESLNPDIENPEDMRLYRIRQAMERLVLMIQRRSTFSQNAGLHSALGVNPYARFSAPMREIVGVFTHKEACEAELNAPSALTHEENARLRQRVIEASNHAKSVQREVDKAIDSCAIAHVVSHDYHDPVEKRPHRRGTILGMKASALYVRLDMPPIELKVYIKDMADAAGCNWVMNASMTQITREDGAESYTVGDSMTVMVSSFEPVKKKWRVVNVIDKK